MRVFISWSGTLSREIAEALRDWLPCVINSVEPFVSAQDIYAGSRWQSEIANQLESTNFGIVVVTSDNQEAPWLNFEAGALAKAVDASRVVPLAVNLKPADIKQPLGQFQAQPLTVAGVTKIVESINDACEPGLTDQLLQRAVNKWWGDLETAVGETLERAKSRPQATEPRRGERDLLEEILTGVRSLLRPAPLDEPLRLGRTPEGKELRDLALAAGARSVGWVSSKRILNAIFDEEPDGEAVSELQAAAADRDIKLLVRVRPRRVDESEF